MHLKVSQKRWTVSESYLLKLEILLDKIPPKKYLSYHCEGGQINTESDKNWEI